MKKCLLLLGVIRAIFGGDYRSKGERSKLRRLGKELLDESRGYFFWMNTYNT